MPNQAKTGANTMKWHQKGSPRSAKVYQNGTKLMPKRAKIPKMTPGGKSIIFCRFWTDSGNPLGSMFGPKSDKKLQKSFPEFDAGKVSPNYAQTMGKTHVNDDRIPYKI